MVTSRGLTALIVCGGGPIRERLSDDGFVVAADGGLGQAARLGLRVDLLVGDLDSALPEDVERFERGGGQVERHPPDKDATDLELAMQACVDRGATRVVVAAGVLGRLDHVLGNALVLASPRWSAVQVDAVFGAARAHVIRGMRELDGVPAELISLFALGDRALGVTTSGLRWELHDDVLEPGSGLGISNEFTTGSATIALGSGVILAVRAAEETA